MTDHRRLSAEERARDLIRRGLPLPLAGVLCGDGGCAGGFTFPEWWALIREFIERRAYMFGLTLHDAAGSANWPGDLLDVGDDWRSFECDGARRSAAGYCNRQSRWVRCSATPAWSTGPRYSAADIAEILESEISTKLVGVMGDPGVPVIQYDGDGVRRINEFISDQMSRIYRQYGPNAVIESCDYDAENRRMSFTIRAPLVTLGSPMTFFDVDLGDDGCDE